jgi:hypothetical protein
VAYEVANLKVTTPTRSKLREGANLLTCGGENDRERPAMRRWLGHPSTMERRASSGTPTSGMALKVAVVAGAPPTGDGLAWEALKQQLNGGSVLGSQGAGRVESI